MLILCTIILHDEAIKQKAGVASLTINFTKNSNCEDVRSSVVSYDEDTRKKGYLKKLTHTGRFSKNDIILIKFNNAADIWVTVFRN